MNYQHETSNNTNNDAEDDAKKNEISTQLKLCGMRRVIIFSRCWFENENQKKYAGGRTLLLSVGGGGICIVVEYVCASRRRMPNQREERGVRWKE